VIARALLACLLASACVADGEPAAAREPADPESRRVLGDIVILDEASEERLEEIAIRVENGDVTIDDARAAKLSPMPAVALRSTPPAFLWERPTVAVPPGPRHGINVGTFTWLHIYGDGMRRPVDLVALGSTVWTPDEPTWQAIGLADQVTVTITTAHIQPGTFAWSGPYRPTDASLDITLVD
jgi:hypothetical protein